VVDGEAVLLGVDGISDFDGLHSHRHNEVQFYAFDIRVSGGEDLRKLPLSFRKTNLARLLARRVDGIFLSDFERGEIGPELYRHACLMSLEGLVSKLVDGPRLVPEPGQGQKSRVAGDAAGQGCVLLMDGELPRLTRRRDPEARSESWHVWYDGVRVGTITASIGLRASVNWVWTCGFHTGLPDGKQRSGTATSYADARGDFEAAWAVYLPTRTPEYFDAWRHHTAWTAEKYARWERGDRGAPPWPLPGFVFRHR
jgi:bifunctional non-homologous end joining protein LigD